MTDSTPPDILLRPILPTHLVAAFSLAGGIAMGRLPNSDMMTTALLLVAIIALVRLLTRPGRLLCGIAFLCGLILILAHDTTARSVDGGSVLPVGTGMTITLIIDGVQKVSGFSTRYLVNIESIDGEPTPPIRARWYAPVKRWPERFLPGDILLLTGATIKQPTSYSNSGGFDYVSYLHDRGVTRLIFTPAKATLSNMGAKFHWRRSLEAIRENMRQTLDFESRGATAIAHAMLLGDQGLIEPTLRSRFQAAGVAHLLAVSGLHVGFVAAAVYGLVKVLLFVLLFKVRYRWLSAGVPMTIAAGAALVAAVGYALLTGPGFPAQRAAIMIAVYLTALIIGEGRNFIGAFAVALTITLLLTPWALFEAGFQLSFVTVFCIALFLDRVFNRPAHEEEDADIMIRLTRRSPVLAGYGGLSLAAWLGSAPLAAYHFHQVSIVALPVNLLLVPLASIAVPWGIFWSSGLSEYATSLTGLMMQIMERLVVVSAEPLLSSRPLPAIPAVSVALCYLLAGLFYALRPGRQRRMVVSVMAMALLVSLAVRPVIDMLDTDVQIRFLDVGQGDATLIIWPGGGVIAIDGGSRYGGFDVGRSVVAPALAAAQRTRLTALFASHGDRDHVGGLPGLIDHRSVGAIYDNGLPADNRLLVKLRQEAVRRGVYKPLFRGDVIDYSGGLRIEILHPPRPDGESRSRNDNESSLVMRVSYGDLRILFTGDIGTATEKELMASGIDLSADILKVAHHGSGRSTGQKFLKAVNAHTAVISVGAANRFAHPAPDTIRRLQKADMRILRTDRDGEVVFRAAAVRDTKNR